MTTTKNNSAEATSDRSLVISRVFDAPRRLVFEAWTKKEHLDQWCAPRGVTIPFSEGDFRPGGKWRCVMLTPDGQKLPLGGVYREIVVNELLVFTHIWEEDDGKPGHETLVKVRFEDEGKKTKVTLEQTNFKSIESRDGHIGGWSSALDVLAEYLLTLSEK